MTDPTTMGDSVPCLLRAARGMEKNRAARGHLMAGISAFMGAAAVPHMMAFLETQVESPPDADPSLRETQGLINAILINMAEADPEEVEPIIDGVRSAVSSSEGAFKQVSLLVLANLAPDSPSVVGILEEELAAETDPEMRESIQSALDHAKSSAAG